MSVLPACVYVQHMLAWCLQSQRVADPLEPELWMVVSRHAMWVLGAEPRSL